MKQWESTFQYTRAQKNEVSRALWVAFNYKGQPWDSNSSVLHPTFHTDRQCFHLWQYTCDLTKRTSSIWKDNVNLREPIGSISCYMFNFNNYFIFCKYCVCMGMCMYIGMWVHWETGRWSHIPWKWSYKCLWSTRKGTGNQILDFWKSKKHSEPLKHLSSPSL